MKTLYLECYSGISGDMTVAALLDMGADEQGLMKLLGSLGLSGFEVRTGRAVKNGISAYDFDVVLEGLEDGCDHDHDHHHHDHGHHDHDHHHHHDHDHHHHHGHVHRGLPEIYEIIDGMDANDHVKEMSKRIFDVVAEAESEAHDLPKEEVHFHEVGAVDSIVDIISAAYCIDDLGIEKIIVSDLYEGTGHVHCQHGTIPVPVPAVTNIARNCSLKLHITDNEGEMVTPTGAAIAGALGTSGTMPGSFDIIATGLGAGKKDFEKANILRAFLIEENGEEKPEEDIFELETNIDDCTGEALAYTLEQLMAHGARDAFFVPIIMKKNRPAYMLKVICDRCDVGIMEDLIFENTSTIGIRKFPVERRVLDRGEASFDLNAGRIDVKIIECGGQKRYVPEAESVKRVCEEKGIGWNEAYSMIMRELAPED